MLNKKQNIKNKKKKIPNLITVKYFYVLYKQHYKLRKKKKKSSICQDQEVYYKNDNIFYTSHSRRI